VIREAKNVPRVGLVELFTVFQVHDGTSRLVRMPLRRFGPAFPGPLNSSK
jgi:hypothetical protein